jgi:hypothetical protein
MAARRAGATRARAATRARGGECARAAALTFLRRRWSVNAVQEHRMSARVMVMEDGRARESEGGEHGMDELLVLLLSAVTFDKKQHDQFPRPVTKCLCAIVS